MLPAKFFRYATIVAIVLLTTLALLTFRDYGVTWDEELQSQYGQAIDDYYESGFQDQRYAEIQNLYLYGGMFDGLASVFDSFTPTQAYDTRHLINALFGLLGLWGVWRLGKFLGGDAVGFVAMVLCATTPMYYGHMFNNPKDIPFAAGIVWSLYFMFRTYSRPKIPVLLKLGVVLGLTCGVRVGGVMLFAFWLAPIIANILQPLWLRHDKKTLSAVAQNAFHTTWRVILPVAALAYIIMLLCWPWAQQHPLTNPLKALSEFSEFPHKVKVLLDGTSYYSTQLPWFYIPVYFGIKLPELFLLLLGLSVFFLPKIWRDLSYLQKQSFSLMLLMLVLPIIYAIVMHSSLYDCVRHFIFAVPLLSVMAALGLQTCFAWGCSQLNQPNHQHRMGSALALLLIGGVVYQLVVMAQLHPYEYIFANQFAGGINGAYGRYESDYWGESFKEAAEKLQAYVAKEGGVPKGKIFRVAICGPWDSAMIYLPPDYERVDAKKQAEFYFSTTRWACQDLRAGKEIIRVQRKGVPLSIVKDLRGGFEDYLKK